MKQTEAANRSHDPEAQVSMRAKGGEADYRYFPEPDLPALVFDEAGNQERLFTPPQLRALTRLFYPSPPMKSTYVPRSSLKLSENVSCRDGPAGNTTHAYVHSPHGFKHKPNSGRPQNRPFDLIPHYC